MTMETRNREWSAAKNNSVHQRWYLFNISFNLKEEKSDVSIKSAQEKTLAWEEHSTHPFKSEPVSAIARTFTCDFHTMSLETHYGTHRVEFMWNQSAPQLLRLSS